MIYCRVAAQVTSAQYRSWYRVPENSALCADAPERSRRQEIRWLWGGPSRRRDAPGVLNGTDMGLGSILDQAIAP